MPASGITSGDIRVISESPPLTTMDSPEISVKDLHFSYNKDSPILRGISVTLSGEPTAIIGQNGAGKTTFVKLLKALLKPSSGEIIINGTNTKNMTAAKLAGHNRTHFPKSK